jgi:hypothetical protein
MASFTWQISLSSELNSLGALDFGNVVVSVQVSSAQLPSVIELGFGQSDFIGALRGVPHTRPVVAAAAQERSLKMSSDVKLGAHPCPDITFYLQIF